MKVQIVCSVPTVYQLRSISNLMPNYWKIPGGGYTAKETWNSKKEAIEQLKVRAWALYNADKFTELEYKDAIKEIKKYGCLTYNAATARIEIPEIWYGVN